MPLRLRFRAASRRREPEVLDTYSFPSRTVQVLLTPDEHIEWVCDCEKFRSQSTRGAPLWCKHIAKAAARRSIERFTRRVTLPGKNLER